MQIADLVIEYLHPYYSPWQLVLSALHQITSHSNLHLHQQPYFNYTFHEEIPLIWHIICKCGYKTYNDDLASRTFETLQTRRISA
jgi:hypothetical protein